MMGRLAELYRLLSVGGIFMLAIGNFLWGQERDIAALADEMELRVEASLRKYEVLQNEIAGSKIPLLEKINELENKTSNSALATRLCEAVARILHRCGKNCL